jgi:heme A synthase
LAGQKNLEWLRRRVMLTLVPAFLGGLAGALYAKSTLSPEVLARTSLGAMYAAAGAATMILALRIAAILRLMLRDLRGSKRAPPDEPGPEPPAPPPPDGPDRAV